MKNRNCLKLPSKGVRAHAWSEKCMPRSRARQCWLPGEDP
jgi:hypothetical protein